VAWSVLIVDDHAGFRSSARALLEADGFDVLGEAADGDSAMEQARRLRPQVVLLDVQLPGLDGFAVAERLAAEPAAPAVVLISSRGRGAYRARLERAPARGFITKAEFSGECLTSLLE
jgi:DNA-binding NarL/FixJ family response regulator